MTSFCALPRKGNPSLAVGKNCCSSFGSQRGLFRYFTDCTADE